jgi:hypothetical protein
VEFVAWYEPLEYGKKYGSMHLSMHEAGKEYSIFDKIYMEECAA